MALPAQGSSKLALIHVGWHLVVTARQYEIVLGKISRAA
jgi:hypothetical protein